MSEILTSLNWKLIIIYLIATSIVVMGLTQLSLLTDLELLDAHRKGRDLSDLDLLGPRLIAFVIWTKVFSLTGLIISGLIIFQLTRKTKYYWTNLWTVLLLGFLADRFGLLSIDFIKDVTLSFGRLFSKLGLAYPFIINGVVLIGLVIFYNKWTNKLTSKVE